MNIPKETAQQILRFLFTNANGDSADAIKKYQGNTLPNFGIMYPQIKELIAKYEPSNEVAIELITKNTREARIIACILSIPDQLTDQQIKLFYENASTEELKNIFARHILAPLINLKKNNVFQFSKLGFSIEIIIKALIQYFRAHKTLPEYVLCIKLLSDWIQKTPTNLNDGKHFTEVIYQYHKDKRETLKNWLSEKAQSNKIFSEEIFNWKNDLQYL